MNGLVLSRRVCPACGGRKAFYAKACRSCSPRRKPLLGRKGPDHPAWRGGRSIDRDGYVRLYLPDYPWHRKNSYVLEHVAVMERHLGRRLTPDESIHHKDHDRQNNVFSNLELTERGNHSRHHRRLDGHLRRRDGAGRFA